jgi:hypothetical protein
MSAVVLLLLLPLLLLAGPMDIFWQDPSEQGIQWPVKRQKVLAVVLTVLLLLLLAGPMDVFCWQDPSEQSIQWVREEATTPACAAAAAAACRAHGHLLGRPLRAGHWSPMG